MKYQTTIILILANSIATMAQVILVDFGKTAGTPPGWNSASPIYMGTPLLFTDGSDSGAEIFGSPWVEGLDSSVAGAFTATATWAAEAAQDNYHGNSDIYYVQIDNLDTNSFYTIELISSQDSSYGGWFTINGAYADNNPEGNYFWSYGDGYINGTVMVWQNLHPDSNGTLLLYVQRGDPRSYLAINAMRITISPEPQPMRIAATTYSGSRPGLIIMNPSPMELVFVQRHDNLLNTNWTDVTNFYVSYTNWTDDSIPSPWIKVFYRLVR